MLNNLEDIVLKRTYADQVRDVSVFVAIGVTEDGFCQILGILEGSKEDKAGRSNFSRHLKKRGLGGAKLFIGDACLGLIESVNAFYPDAKCQRSFFNRCA